MIGERIMIRNSARDRLAPEEIEELTWILHEFFSIPSVTLTAT